MVLKALTGLGNRLGRYTAVFGGNERRRVATRLGMSKLVKDHRRRISPQHPYPELSTLAIEIRWTQLSLCGQPIGYRFVTSAYSESNFGSSKRS